MGVFDGGGGFSTTRVALLPSWPHRSKAATLRAVLPLLIFCVVATDVTFAGTYSVVAPAVLRPNRAFTAVVSVHNASETVRVDLEVAGDLESSASPFSTRKQAEMVPHSSQLLKFQMGDLEPGKYRLTVTGSTGSPPAILFRNSTELRFEPRSFSVFVETDKAVYRPGERVRFRVIVLSPGLRPTVTGAIDVRIEDGAGTPVRVFPRVFTSKGVFTESLLLAGDPVLGVWGVVVGVLGQERRTSFYVAEFVPPKFDVKLSVPAHLSLQDRTVPVAVHASYADGRLVTGEVTLQITARYKYEYLQAPFDEPVTTVTSINGTAEVELDLVQDLGLRGDDARVLEVAAYVQEAQTRRLQNATAYVTVYRLPYRLRLLRGSPAFKPGLPYTAYLQLAYHDGSPVTSGDVVVRHAFVNDPSAFVATRHSIPSSGLVTLTLHPPLEGAGPAETLALEATYLDLTQWLGTVPRALSPSGAFLQATLLTQAPRVGEEVAVAVATTEAMVYFVYEVVARGEVVYAGTLQAHNGTRHTFRFLASSAMYPRARVVAYYVRHDGEVVADSLHFPVARDRRAEVTLTVTPQEVDVSVTNRVTITVAARPNSIVGVTSLDAHNAALIGAGHRLSTADITAELESYDPGLAYGSRSAGDRAFLRRVRVERSVAVSPSHPGAGVSSGAALDDQNAPENDENDGSTVNKEENPAEKDEETAGTEENAAEAPGQRRHTRHKRTNEQLEERFEKTPKELKDKSKSPVGQRTTRHRRHLASEGRPMAPQLELEGTPSEHHMARRSAVPDEVVLLAADNVFRESGVVVMTNAKVPSVAPRKAGEYLPGKGPIDGRGWDPTDLPPAYNGPFGRLAEAYRPQNYHAWPGFGRFSDESFQNLGRLSDESWPELDQFSDESWPNLGRFPSAQGSTLRPDLGPPLEYHAPPRPALAGPYAFSNLPPPPDHKPRVYLPQTPHGTWLFTHRRTGPSGVVSWQEDVPQTPLTSYALTAFAIDDFHGLVVASAPAQVTVGRPWRVTVHAAPTVVLGEALAVQTTVYNDGPAAMTVTVTLLNSDGRLLLDVGPDGSADGAAPVARVRRQASVAANGRTTLSFPAIPTAVGAVNLTVTAETDDGRQETAVRQLTVRPEGRRLTVTKSVLYDPSAPDAFEGTVNVTMPRNVVAGSLSVEVSVSGDLLGFAVASLARLTTQSPLTPHAPLFELPLGCGEQNMAAAVATLATLDHLKAQGRLSRRLEEAAVEYLRLRLQQQLSHRQTDGSFAYFDEYRPTFSSTWLTAYVAKSLKSLEPYVPVPKSIITSALEWTVQQQDATDGTFVEPEVPKKFRLNGAQNVEVFGKIRGFRNSPLALTAHVLLAILEVEDYSNSAVRNAGNRALEYISNALKNSPSDTYGLAIATYALHVAGHPHRDTAFYMLDNMATVRDGEKFWCGGNVSVSTEEGNLVPSFCTEQTAYALLAYARRGLRSECARVVRWLVGRMGDRGGFSSSQDTAVGLTALAAAQRLLSPDGAAAGSAATDGGAADEAAADGATADGGATVIRVVYGERGQRFGVTNDVQTLQLPNATRQVSVTGTGGQLAVLRLQYAYNVRVTAPRPAFTLDPQLVRGSDPHTLRLTPCVGVLGGKWTSRGNDDDLAPRDVSPDLSGNSLSPGDSVDDLPPGAGEDSSPRDDGDVPPGSSEEDLPHSNMAVLEVALPSGYVIDRDSIPGLYDYPGVRRVEPLRPPFSGDGDDGTGGGEIRTGVALYFDSITTREVCPTVVASRLDGVALQKPGSVVVYDYYDLTRQARQFYDPVVTSVCHICDDCGPCDDRTVQLDRQRQDPDDLSVRATVVETSGAGAGAEGATLLLGGLLLWGAVVRIVP